MTGHVVCEVTPGSPAFKAGILPGDELVSINGIPVCDLFDYQAMTQTRRFTVVVLRNDEHLSIEVRKRSEESLGLSFADDLLGNMRTCRNRCVFCFVDQLPKGMRETLYVKDDDWRYSVLMGNYVTLTNLSEEDARRIERLKISPLYVSVHAADSRLRTQMLGRKRNGDVMALLERFANAGITIHAQAVLCPGINDGDALRHTAKQLAQLHPAVASVALVPVGLTSHRQGLAELRPFNMGEAREIVRECAEWQSAYLEKLGTRFVFPADEFYQIAEVPPPEYEDYEDFSQIENGVGMLRLFEREFTEELPYLPKPRERRVAVITGVSAAPFLQSLKARLSLPNVQVTVVAAQNTLLGETVTVAGLVCGADAVRAMRGVIADEAIIPASMLREQGDVFLDDMTVRDVERELGIPVYVVAVNGAAFARALCGVYDAEDE